MPMINCIGKNAKLFSKIILPIYTIAGSTWEFILLYIFVKT